MARGAAAGAHTWRSLALPAAQFSFLFFLPLALFCPPEAYALHRGLNTVYQVWVCVGVGVGGWVGGGVGWVGGWGGVGWGGVGGWGGGAAETVALLNVCEGRW